MRYIFRRLEMSSIILCSVRNSQSARAPSAHILHTDPCCYCKPVPINSEYPRTDRGLAQILHRVRRRWLMVSSMATSPCTSATPSQIHQSPSKFSVDNQIARADHARRKKTWASAFHAERMREGSVGGHPLMPFSTTVSIPQKFDSTDLDA